MSYIIITPVRNEASHFPRTIKSVMAQTVLPERWIIVDDGSTDGTGELAEGTARRHSWVTALRRADRGGRLPGTGVIEAVEEGLRELGASPWDFLAKLDGDLSFAPDYFEGCFSEFARNARLGIGGGLVCREEQGRLVAESRGDPAFHVRGATKIYRRQCWEDIGGLVRAPGWDTVDELKANMLGWHTYTFTERKLHQLKDTGSADGNWRNWVKNGLANYIAGYHPLFMAAKCVKRSRQKPYGIAAAALAWGFVKGYLSGRAGDVDQRFVRYVRGQQLNRLCHRPSLWSRTIEELRG